MDFGTNSGTPPENTLGRGVDGDFETRLTVRADPPDRVMFLRDWASSHGLDVTHVVLDRGRTPSRPLITLRGSGSLREQLRAADEYGDLLRSAGFEVVRTKIEAAPWNDGVPQTAAEAAVLPAACQFEHRVTLRLPIPYHAQRLNAVTERHQAHLSRTARRVLTGGVQMRFVTQRARGVGRPEARGRLHALLDGLFAAGFPPVDVEEAFVLHDDNPAADSGWIKESG